MRLRLVSFVLHKDYVMIHISGKQTYYKGSVMQLILTDEVRLHVCIKRIIPVHSCFSKSFAEFLIVGVEGRWHTVDGWRISEINNEHNC